MLSSPANTTVLVTGASGFVGRCLAAALRARGYLIRAALRTPGSLAAAPDIETLIVADIAKNAAWRPAVEGIQTVIHLAGRAPVVHEPDGAALARYREVNVLGTQALAAAASAAGVRRFIYMSSIKVNGEATSTRPYTEADVPRAEDAYGVSKWEAEQALAGIARRTGMETVVLRPPLVYGAHVKGNLLRLMRALDRHVPLPLASIRNRRSLIAVGNLADAVLRCIESPQAAGKTYLVADGEDVATPELIRHIAAGLGVKPLLFPCPIGLLDAAARTLGKRDEVRRLTGSLQIDSSRIRTELGWKPPITVADGLREMAAWYRDKAREAKGKTGQRGDPGPDRSRSK